MLGVILGFLPVFTWLCVTKLLLLFRVWMGHWLHVNAVSAMEGREYSLRSWGGNFRFCKLCNFSRFSRPWSQVCTVAVHSKLLTSGIGVVSLKSVRCFSNKKKKSNVCCLAEVEVFKHFAVLLIGNPCMYTLWGHNVKLSVCYLVFLKP